jgi:hypothetical protein
VSTVGTLPLRTREDLPETAKTSEGIDLPKNEDVSKGDEGQAPGTRENAQNTGCQGAENQALGQEQDPQCNQAADQSVNGGEGGIDK